MRQEFELIKLTPPQKYSSAAPGSCVEHHMVGVINENQTFTLAKQKFYIDEFPHLVVPGEAWPDDVPRIVGADDDDDDEASASATPSPSSPTPAPAFPPTSPPPPPPLSAGGIAGVAIGGTVVLIAVAVLLYLCGRKGGFEKGFRQSPNRMPTMMDMGMGMGGGGVPMVEANYPPDGNMNMGLASSQQPKSPAPAYSLPAPALSTQVSFRVASPAEEEPSFRAAAGPPGAAAAAQWGAGQQHMQMQMHHPQPIMALPHAAPLVEELHGGGRGGGGSSHGQTVPQEKSSEPPAPMPVELPSSESH
ncbi:hypothetical protein F4778DRAFT_109289 [Xylariomycetidae sp. FL2044]|nr:hypothetical protein F4778DRAFT_109289 [Xylariomycetidae sp. FL2044]